MASAWGISAEKKRIYLCQPHYSLCLRTNKLHETLSTSEEKITFCLDAWPIYTHSAASSQLVSGVWLKLVACCGWVLIKISSQPFPLCSQTIDQLAPTNGQHSHSDQSSSYNVSWVLSFCCFILCCFFCTVKRVEKYCPSKSWLLLNYLFSR